MHAHKQTGNSLNVIHMNSNKHELTIYTGFKALQALLGKTLIILYAANVEVFTM